MTVLKVLALPDRWFEPTVAHDQTAHGQPL
jgi:hypothetical protein